MDEKLLDLLRKLDGNLWVTICDYYDEEVLFSDKVENLLMYLTKFFRTTNVIEYDFTTATILIDLRVKKYE